MLAVATTVGVELGWKPPGGTSGPMTTIWPAVRVTVLGEALEGLGAACSVLRTLAPLLEPRLRMEPSVRPARRRPWASVWSRSFHARLSFTLTDCALREAAGMRALTSPAV